MSNIFETVEASRQKELIFVCTENPVTVQHVKVDYWFLIHPMIPLQKLKKKMYTYISPFWGFNSLCISFKTEIRESFDPDRLNVFQPCSQLGVDNSSTRLQAWCRRISIYRERHILIIMTGTTTYCSRSISSTRGSRTLKSPESGRMFAQASDKPQTLSPIYATTRTTRFIPYRQVEVDNSIIQK